MLDTETKRKIDTARDILVGKVPDPKSQVEQITIALIYKFMDDMDKEAISFGGKAAFFTGDFKQYSWSSLFSPKLGGADRYSLYEEGLKKLSLHPDKNFPNFFRKIFEGAKVPYADVETLNMFLKIIDDFTYEHSEKLGDAFEYLLSILGSQGDAGQFRTPRHIIDFIVEVLQPKKNETICDPACGTAGFLISSYKHILQQNTKKNKGDQLTPDDRKKMMQNVVGYDISPDMVRLSLVNMYLHGFTTPSIYEYDTLTSEDKWNEYYDVILANPPFMTPKGGIKPHKKFTIQANRSEVLFVDYIAEHIHPTTGRAGIIVPEGIIFQSATAYKALRKMLVEKNMLYAVVSLPAGIFQPYSGVKTSILLLDKTLAKKTENILFVKIDNDGFDLGAQRRANDKSDLASCLELLQQYKTALQKNTIFESDNKNVFVVEKEKVKGNGDYNLSVDRYRVNENVQASNFEIVNLRDVCEFTQGVQIQQEEQINVLKDGYKRYLYISDFLHDNKLIYVLDKYPNKEVTEDDLIMVNTGNTSGKIFLGKKGILSNNLFKITFSKEKLLSKYLYYLIVSEKFYLELSKYFKQGAQPHLGHKIIGEQKIPLPPLSIQQQIVSKIESYQKIIDGAKQVTKNYKPQIEINPDWKMVKLGEVCEKITKGTTPTTNGFMFEKSGIYFIKINNINDDGKILKDKIHFITEECHQSLMRSQLKEEDVLFSIAGTDMGITGIVDYSIVPANTNQALAILRVADKSNLSHKYLFHVLRSNLIQDEVEKTKVGVAQFNFSLQQVSNIEIPFPPIIIQLEIVKRIEEEQALVNSNKKLIQIFEQKIKDEINKLWQAEPKEYVVDEEVVSMAAEE